MATINPELRTQLENEPEQPVDLIVRTDGDVSPHLAWFANAGVEVRQQSRLTPGAAVTCAGSTALQLLAEEWVLSIETDQTITAM